MITLARADRSLVARWWWSVDRWTLAAILLLALIGALLGMAASPAVAERIGVAPFHFVHRQLAYLPLAVAVLIGTSLLSADGVRRVALAGFGVGLVLLAATPIVGDEIKGATRWLSLGGLTIQPSEFVKPTFAVVAAWLFAGQRWDPAFPGNVVAIALLALVVGLLARQPDVGMATMVTVVWCAQFFLAGLALGWLVLCALGGVGLLGLGYVLLPHVSDRIDQFLDPSSGDTYQSDVAMMAIEQGGFFGRGPGQGQVKDILPDAHADYIFAVAAEEFGSLACLLIIVLFAFVTLRAFARASGDRSLFGLLAVTGLATQFGLQALINMAVNVRLLPPKGMTLPFVSYGGSSLLALALGMGMLLALTRRRYDGGAEP
ncbi:MAG: cell division protein FtsW [Alphaproteobacteria bacterium]|nr:cell division protein FtsW [Alphaproteobacteria bacterium]